MTPRLAVLAALAVAACDGKPAETPEAATFETVGSATPADLAVDVIDTADGKGRYTAKREGRTTQVTFPLAIAQVAPATFHTTERLQKLVEDGIEKLRAAAAAQQQSLLRRGSEALDMMAGAVVDLAVDYVVSEVKRRVRPLTWRLVPRL